MAQGDSGSQYQAGMIFGAKSNHFAASTGRAPIANALSNAARIDYSPAYSPLVVFTGVFSSCVDLCASGAACLWEPRGVGPQRCRFRVLDTYCMDRRGGDARVHAVGGAPARHAAASRLVRRGVGRALDPGCRGAAAVAGGAPPPTGRRTALAGSPSLRAPAAFRNSSTASWRRVTLAAHGGPVNLLALLAMLRRDCRKRV